MTCSNNNISAEETKMQIYSGENGLADSEESDKEDQGIAVLKDTIELSDCSTESEADERKDMMEGESAAVNGADQCKEEELKRCHKDKRRRETNSLDFVNTFTFKTII
ncbi:hypothetical protein ABFA07_021649 [Porites harrisoni]